MSVQYRTVRAVLAGVLGLGIAACSGSAAGAGSPSASPAASRTNHLNGTSSQNRLAFAQCMRANGVPGFPDNFGAKGAIQAAGIDPHSGAYQSAVRACAAKLR